VSDRIDPRLEEIISCLYRVATKAVVVAQDKILLVQEEQGWYGLPGGGVEHGQDLRESLVREIEEELGAALPVDKIPAQPFLVSNAGVFDGIPRVTMCYSVVLDTTEFPIPSELKHAWVGADDFKDTWLAPNIEPLRAELAKLLA
jgi:8-oxo-dGTP diphosphatase